jgi:hypothetical protein
MFPQRAVEDSGQAWHLKMKAARSSETSGTSNPATQFHVSEDMGPAGCGYLGWLNRIRMNPLVAFCVRCTIGTSCYVVDCV